MDRTALSFSYNGYHRKSKGGRIDPIKHLQMLVAAIDCANPEGEHDVIVSAIGFNAWEMGHEERILALEVYKRSRMILSTGGDLGHQGGASYSIRMATEFASACGYDRMVHLAEDVVMMPGFAEYFARHLRDADYVGAHWITNSPERSPYSLNTQVFGCRPRSFADLKNRHFVMPYIATEIEMEIFDNINTLGLTYKVGATPEDPHLYPDGYSIPYQPWRGKKQALYDHTHDPDEFRRLVERRGVVWCESPRQKISRLRTVAASALKGG